MLAHRGHRAVQILEKLMCAGTYEYQSDSACKRFFEGEAEGQAKDKAILSVEIPPCERS